MPSVDEAEALAGELLAPLGDRWAHVRAVAARAAELTPAVDSEDEQHLLIVSAWWHDLGYSPVLRDTGVHQIDGARYLAVRGYPQRLVALVAHHSAATYEVTERGLLADLEVWRCERSAVADALWTADMTTGPRGEEFVYDDRLSEILSRYGRDSVVGRAMLAAEHEVRAAIDRTRQRMAEVRTASPGRSSIAAMWGSECVRGRAAQG